MNNTILKLLTIIFTFSFSLLAQASEVDSFFLNLKNEILTVNINKKENKYLLSIEDNKNTNTVGSPSQIYPLKNNKSKYPEYTDNDIDYRIVTSKKLNDNILISLRNKDTSLFITTYQEDNPNYNFIIRYDYNYKNKSFNLKKVYYITQELNEENNDKKIYNVIIPTPDKIKDLKTYNRKILSEFIVNSLYKSIDNINLKLIYDSNNTDYFSTLFSCVLSNKKNIMILNNANKNHYIYENKTNVELTYPNKNEHPISFDNKNNIIHFNRGDYEYSITKKKENDYTLSVKNNDKIIFNKSCKNILTPFPSNINEYFN